MGMIRHVASGAVTSHERPINEGDYQNDRDFRLVVHRWLGSIWLEKDARLDDLKRDSQLSPGVA